MEDSSTVNMAVDRCPRSDFELFYNANHQRFVKYALFYVQNLETAKDITHDALLCYWENRANIPIETDVVGYMVIAIKNRCLNYLKHLKVEMEYSKKCSDLYAWEVDIRIDTLGHAGYSEIFFREIMEIVNNSLLDMPKQTKEIFVLNHFQGKTRKEIAEMLEVSQQKIDYHINKAQRHLFKDLVDFLPIIICLATCTLD